MESRPENTALGLEGGQVTAALPWPPRCSDPSTSSKSSWSFLPLFLCVGALQGRCRLRRRFWASQLTYFEQPNSHALWGVQPGTGDVPWFPSSCTPPIPEGSSTGSFCSRLWAQELRHHLPKLHRLSPVHPYPLRVSTALTEVCRMQPWSENWKSHEENKGELRCPVGKLQTLKLWQTCSVIVPCLFSHWFAGGQEMLPGCVSSSHLCSVSKKLHLLKEAGKERPAPPLSKALTFALGEMKPPWVFYPQMMLCVQSEFHQHCPDGNV